MSYTINKIQQEMTADGSHWWDRGTMRFFRTRVSEQVYQGEGGIYFVTSEKGPSGKRRYSVRKYDPATKDIDTVGEFNEMTRDRAHREAARLAGESAVVIKDAHRSYSEAEQLVIDLERNCHITGLRTIAAEHLIDLATQHKRMMEDYCNIPNADVFDDDGPRPRLAKLRALILKEAKAMGCTGVKFSGDPRGATVKLILPNGETNDWGKEGWCVPTRD
jgi:hypothetical protein